MINGNRTKSDRPRSQRDFYETPIELCEMALTLLYDDLNLQPSSILDPGCGTGNWGKAVRNTWNEYPLLFGVDLNFEVSENIYDSLFKQNYLNYISHLKFGLIVGNPPYSLAEEFIQKSLSLVQDDGYIFFLLRLDFLASQKRLATLYNLYPKTGLRTVYVSSRRPSFYSTNGKHTVDTLEYAMYLWQKGYTGETTLKWFYWEYND